VQDGAAYPATSGPAMRAMNASARTLRG
jgi:hypothetical protein